MFPSLQAAVQFSLVMNEEPEFIRMKEIATIAKPDILLIEGYKEEQGEKVVLLGLKVIGMNFKVYLISELVVGNANIELNSLEIISRTDEKQLNSWLLNWVREGNKNETI